MLDYRDYEESTHYIKKQIGSFVPEVLIILGSGLGFMGEQVENAHTIAYGKVPHMRASTAPGHKGQFIFGTLCGRKVMVMQGRIHNYEGYSAADIAFPVRVAKLLGVTSMVVTNACGAVNRQFQVGDLMVISDHIKLFDVNPVRGENIQQFGERFFDMTHTYCEEYQNLALESGKTLGLPMRQGVYFYFPGPQFETPAEIRAVGILGGDVCGMSTVPEVITAHHCGIKILGISLVTNMAAGVSGQKITGQEVIDEAFKAKDGFSKLICTLLPRL